MIGALCIAIVFGLLAGGAAWIMGFGGWVVLATYTCIGMVVFLGVLAARLIYAKPGMDRQVRIISNSEEP